MLHVPKSYNICVHTVNRLGNPGYDTGGVYKIYYDVHCTRVCENLHRTIQRMLLKRVRHAPHDGTLRARSRKISTYELYKRKRQKKYCPHTFFVDFFIYFYFYCRSFFPFAVHVYIIVYNIISSWLRPHMPAVVAFSLKKCTRTHQ